MLKPILGALGTTAIIALPVRAESSLMLVYPPSNHTTTAAQIFLIGSAPPDAEVTVNGEVMGDRSPAGNFAPSFPLKVGENQFELRYRDQTISVTVTRQSTEVTPPTTLGFVEDSLEPQGAIARQPNEPICFRAVGLAKATVFVQLGQHRIPLLPTTENVTLPPNFAALTLTNQPQVNGSSGLYQGCTAFAQPGSLGQPVFQIQQNGRTARQTAPGAVEILSPSAFEVIAVTSEQGVARTGPGTDYSRLTPLPQGTQARITGRGGDWLRLDYGGWIHSRETEVVSGAMPAEANIRSFRTQRVQGWTEVHFPLDVPVPIRVDQDTGQMTLTLYNTTAQTDTAFLNDTYVIQRLDWQQVAPGQVAYRIHLQNPQGWGYKLRYDDTTLVLSLRHPPELPAGTLRYGNQITSGAVLPAQSLSGISILLDPGHGSDEDLGAVGPTGIPEKDVALTLGKLLQQALIRRGARVIMTREGDEDLWPQDRVDVINESEPAIALSLHYNALPDDGDAINTAGIGTFWYHTQSHDLAQFLHDYLTEDPERHSYGVFWNNLALTRPTVAPAVLLELGFMINPIEYEWIIDPQAQEQLAERLANGIEAWFRQQFGL
ncbi:N-acetylmuramoyl-L-alanine amidase [Synechococcales cyanobacterium C]|uniref:N-acetylmuramoyl-L-alanine amidase n=1 Tax=Petrachloros mirabilis ULC683 TaxID=2781853 RepID=A0A8K2A6D0_9CYAN|nr:N-acetylmuramoyl-L-alanine amidase [Petrachloros mirabilis]NCJ05244.1 N-acetylmuramoyl-L-alanine amidase [Petrachloros mirabilis ULC683]